MATTTYALSFSLPAEDQTSDGRPAPGLVCATPIASLVAVLKEHKGSFMPVYYANIVLAPLVVRLDGSDESLQALLAKHGWCRHRGFFTADLDLRHLQSGLQKHLYVPYQRIGQGAYGAVFWAYNRETLELHAVKVVNKTEYGGLCPATIREVSTLRALNHPNVIKLRDVYTHAASRHCHLVLEPMTTDLHALLVHHHWDHHHHHGGKSGGPLQDSRTIKSVMYQLLSGLHHIHSHSIMHRDLKPQNILLAWKQQPGPQQPGQQQQAAAPAPQEQQKQQEQEQQEQQQEQEQEVFQSPPSSPASPFPTAAATQPPRPPRLVVKIADFGLARGYLPSGGAVAEDPRQAAYTDWVVTIFYRAPELLLQSNSTTTINLYNDHRNNHNGFFSNGFSNGQPSRTTAQQQRPYRYGPAVDIWSAGCVAAELLLGGVGPLFHTPGGAEDELGLLRDMFSKLGAPPEELVAELGLDMGGMRGQQGQQGQQGGVPLEQLVPRLATDPLGRDLLTRMLSWDPLRRITASEALRHPWFDEVRQEEEEAMEAAALEAQAAAQVAAAAAARAASMARFG